MACGARAVERILKLKAKNARLQTVPRDAIIRSGGEDAPGPSPGQSAPVLARHVATLHSLPPSLRGEPPLWHPHLAARSRPASATRRTLPTGRHGHASMHIEGALLPRPTWCLKSRRTSGCTASGLLLVAVSSTRLFAPVGGRRSLRARTMAVGPRFTSAPVCPGAPSTGARSSAREAASRGLRGLRGVSEA